MTAKNWITSISAVTLSTADMARSVAFYEALGFRVEHGGPEATFTSLAAGPGHLNLQWKPDLQPPDGWGRIIFHVRDVDAFHRRALDRGLRPETGPRDASWGERFFHIRDPDGHELSFARPLA